MDYEKLIEQLKQKDGLWCSVPTGEKLVTDAADALTALLAESEKLRDEAEGMRSNWYKAVEAVKDLRAEQEKAKTEITRLKHYEDKCHDCPIVCAKTEIIKAHEELEAVQAELEQVKRCIEIVENQRDSAIKELENYMVQDVLDGNEPCAICAKASDTPCEYCNPKWRGQKED